MGDATGVYPGRLKGQTAIVTGGSGGLGRATCIALAKAGAHVVVVDVDPGRVEEVVAESRGQGSGADALGLILDVRSEPAMEEMTQQALARFGSIDVLVTCAGKLRARGSTLKPLAQMRTEEWDEVIDTNLKGVFLSNRAVLPAMIARRRGNIVNVSSVSGRQGRAHDSAYCASKFGVIGLSESLAEEVRRYGVRVQVVLPDAVDTPMWDQNGPIPRPSNALPPTHVADFIIYLLGLPGDTVLLSPVIASFQPRRRTAGAETNAPVQAT
jgi:NAD(P)-dependent dehydrogenase (short-subunit alcohol dehydrogenase family)